ncbi:MAG: DUF5681 domain-containing protein [Pseudorhodoplanes sp.]|nr:DUF5681 domain-containing protein [Pseudorhodoplanes sp.]
MSKRTDDPNSRDPITGEYDRDPLDNFAEEKPEESVGYCKPPGKYTWKPGQCPNPKGRKRGSKNEATIWKEILNRKIRIREGKKSRTVTVREAMLLQFTDDALKGNTKSAAFVLSRSAQFAEEGQPSDNISQDDFEVLRAFAERAARNKKDNS